MTREGQQRSEISQTIAAVITGLRDRERYHKQKPRPDLRDPSPDLAERVSDLRTQAARGVYSDARELTSRVEFMQTANASVERFASVQEGFEALAEVALSSQAVFYRTRLRELVILVASDSGVKVQHLAEATSRDRSTVNRWRKRTTEFVERTTQVTRDSAGNTVLVCRGRGCTAEFRIPESDRFTTPAEIEGEVEWVAMYRHWRIAHRWKPSATLQAVSAPTDSNEEEIELNEADSNEEEIELNEADSNEEEIELLSFFADPAVDAAGARLQSLLKEYPYEFFSKDSRDVLKELAEYADKEFNALRGSIYHAESESHWLGRIVKISRELAHYEMKLRLAVLWAFEIGVKKSRIAKAADRTPSTVEGWSLETKELIEQLQAETRLETDSSGATSLVCGRCGTDFRADSNRPAPEMAFFAGPSPPTTTEPEPETADETACAEMYIHWRNHHAD